MKIHYGSISTYLLSSSKPSQKSNYNFAHSNCHTTVTHIIILQRKSPSNFWKVFFDQFPVGRHARPDEENRRTAEEKWNLPGAAAAMFGRTGFIPLTHSNLSLFWKPSHCCLPSTAAAYTVRCWLVHAYTKQQALCSRCCWLQGSLLHHTRDDS